MAFITKQDLTPPFYPEIIEQISRENNALIVTCINTAITDAKGYLSRYDLLKLFGTDSVEPVVDAMYLNKLKRLVAELAAWELVKLANPNVNLELFSKMNDDAVKYLINIQKGMIDPEGWPYKPDDPTTPGNENNNVQWSSNKKRQNFL